MELEPRGLILNLLPYVGMCGAGWWFKMWIASVNKKLEQLTETVNNLRIASAVASEIKSKTENHLSELQKKIIDTNKQVSEINGHLDLVWRILEDNKHIIKNRQSNGSI